MKISAFTMGLLFSAGSLASPSFLPVPSKAGPSQTPVFYAAPKAQKVKQTERNSFYALDVILKWGPQVFETGRFLYSCEKIRTACMLIDYEMVGSFEKCTVRNGKAQCSGPLIAGSPDFESDLQDPNLELAPRFEESEDLTPETSEGPTFQEADPHRDEQPTTEPLVD